MVCTQTSYTIASIPHKSKYYGDLCGLGGPVDLQAPFGAIPSKKPHASSKNSYEQCSHPSIRKFFVECLLYLYCICWSATQDWTNKRDANGVNFGTFILTKTTRNVQGKIRKSVNVVLLNNNNQSID